MKNDKEENTIATSHTAHTNFPVSTAASDFAKCTIHHTGIGQHVEGIISGERVYALDQDGLPRSIRGSCWWVTDKLVQVWSNENDLFQLQVGEKWGFVHADTGKIVVAPVFDYAAPFFDGYAHVAYDLHPGNTRKLLITDTLSLAWWYYAGLREPGGRHGFINKKGGFVIPCMYDDACDVNNDGRFIVVRDGKCGVVDQYNHEVIDFTWNRALYYGYDNWAGYVAARCDGDGENWRWALLGKDGEQYYEGLTKKPGCYTFPKRLNKGESRYLLLKKGRKFGVACSDGRPITFTTMLKRDAVKLINTLEGYGNVY